MLQDSSHGILTSEIYKNISTLLTPTICTFKLLQISLKIPEISFRKQNSQTEYFA